MVLVRRKYAFVSAFFKTRPASLPLPFVKQELDVLDDKLSQYSSIDGEKQEGEKQI